jgi:Cysteine-rich CPXCG
VSKKAPRKIKGTVCDFIRMLWVSGVDLSSRNASTTWALYCNCLRNPLPTESNLAYRYIVEVTESIQCPFCGQRFEIVLDTSIATQRFTTDCEVCCRPFEVFAECEPGEILSIEVQG